GIPTNAASRHRRKRRKESMTAPVPNATESVARSRWQLRLCGIGQLVTIGLITIVLFVMVMLYLNYRDQQRLPDPIAETDRPDPGWRLNDILAARPPLRNEDNGALLLLEAFEMRQGAWIPFNLDSYLGNLAPSETLLPERAKELRAKLAAKEPALIKA